MEASALQAPATLPQTRVAIATPLLRFRSDEQLVALFRAGDEEAFRAIHDRYHKRLFAYTRQMLHGRQDAEDALQDVFVRAYAGLRASNHDLALRAWLFRVAHNRCIDELRRPVPPPPEVLQLVRGTVHDPLVEVDLRESLRRLIEDIRRLPDQQRSALLMRELAGMPYTDMATSLGISIGAVKSLLVRARVALAQAATARDTSCFLIREQLVEAHDQGIRPNANARKHMRDCVGCKSFRRELRGMSRQLAALSPAVGPLGILAKTLGFPGGAKGGAAGGGGLALLGGGATASAGGIAVGVNHVAALLVAAAATAGGAAAIQHTITAPNHHAAHAQAATKPPRSDADPLSLRSPATGIQAIAGAVEATASTAPKLAASAAATTAQRAAAAPLADPLGGGPVHAPVTSSRTRVSSGKAVGTSSGAAGLQKGSGATTNSDSCSAPVASGAGTTAGSTSAGAPAVAAAPVSTSTDSPCLTPNPPSTSSSASTSSGSAAGSGSQTGDDTASSSSTASSASSPSSSGSASSSSSPSTASGGGSASATK